MKKMAYTAEFTLHVSQKSLQIFLRSLRRLWNDRLSTKLAMICIVAFILLPVVSFIWTPYDYLEQNIMAARQGPSAEHYFGTDMLGRDMFTRIMYAGRITVTLMILFTFLGGLPLAILAGMAIFFSRRVDFIVQRIGDAFDGIPPLFLAIILSATVATLYEDVLYGLGALGEWSVRTGVSGLGLILLVTAFLFWIGPARLFRSLVLDLKSSAFVESARMLGASKLRIVGRHVIPQVSAMIAYQALMMYAGVIGTEIALSFLGIGIKPPHPSFGTMFAESVSTRLLGATPHLLVIPGIIVSAFIASIYILAQRITAILSSEHERGEL